METKFFFSKILMFCVAIVAMSMTMVSCSDKDDNEPNPFSEDGYKIIVEDGLTMPVNEFLNVPAVAGDQNVINALNSIDKVTDVKAFKLSTSWDFYDEKSVTKTAYYFNYKQDIDHNNPSKGWFKQQCILTVEGQECPTVLHTEGYALNKDKNKLQETREPLLVSVLDANCLQVEHRYHGWSLPEGYSNKWNYLTAKQHSDDLHAIVTAIKKSGVVGNGKWLSTGVSKNGMTTAFYAYHYPNEMDAYVPFCAPFLLELLSPAPYSFILTKEAFGENQENMDKVKAAFRAYVGDKNLQAECVQIYKKKNPQYAVYSDEELRSSLLTTMFATYFSKMSYVSFKNWEGMIPKAGDSGEKFYDFIMADEDTKYEFETDVQYNRRKDYSDEFEPETDIWQMPYALTRAKKDTRDAPYYVQACIELGSYGLILDWVSDLLTDVEKNSISFGLNPTSYGVTYDKGKFINEFLEGMKQSTCNMLFVYSMQDSWTGGQIPSNKMGVNSSKLFIQHPNDRYSEAGLHNDAIDQWNASEKAQLFKWLNQLGFLPNE